MKPFTTVAAVFLAIVALMQLLRFVLAWPITIDGFAVPVWASAVAFLVAGGLAIMVWREKDR
jgi:hypothetical protein